MIPRDRHRVIQNRFNLGMDDAAHLALYLAITRPCMISARVADCSREERAVKHWFELRRGGWSAEQIALMMIREIDEGYHPVRKNNIMQDLMAFVAGFGLGGIGGLWLGFKLWRQTYVRGLK